MSGGVRDSLIAELRKCRVEDGAPIPLFREDDLFHIASMVLPVVERVVAEARAEALREVEALLPGFEADYGIQSSPVARLRAVLRQAGGGE